MIQQSRRMMDRIALTPSLERMRVDSQEGECDDSTKK